MVLEYKKMSSPHSSAVHSVSGKSADRRSRNGRPSRLTAQVDQDMLGNEHDQRRTTLSAEDELWLRNALQSRLPIF